MANVGFEYMVQNSDKFHKLRQDCVTATKMSLTGITNLVVNYEDPCLVDSFLKSCFKLRELYKETFDIDAVELQLGMPGQNVATQYLDTLIFGSCVREQDRDGLNIQGNYLTDPQSGKRKRNPDGFINRKEVLTGRATDKLLIIKNIDYCLDFCREVPGHVNAASLWIFDNFRNPSVKLGCRILLVTNVRLKFPFKIRTIEFEPVDKYEAGHLIDNFSGLYSKAGYGVEFNDSQKNQLVRKLCGLTYTEAGDAFAQAISKAVKDGEKQIDENSTVKNLREAVNKQFMEDAFGLTHLTPKPWSDYICPESSNFTYDVRKIVRDFEEIDNIKGLINNHNNDPVLLESHIEAVRSRMPHVIVLYGKGGVGKSAFPVHFAGLLDFDVWDFNIGATHSKWIGEGAERMRETLKRINKSTHLVVRIDEYDRAIGATDAGGHGMHEAHKQVESEFMNWLQNSQEDNVFVKNDIFIILTTNHKENITGPLLRSGRADLVIDIADFDEKSLAHTFMTAPTRMKNRGVVCLGMTYPELEQKIKEMDIDKMAALAMQKGFTVRDIDTLLQEMAAHDYYYRRGKEGIAWNQENFLNILEHSEGSVKGDNTSELVLGDRYIMQKKEEKDAQQSFEFYEECIERFDVDKFKEVKFFD